MCLKQKVVYHFHGFYANDYKQVDGNKKKERKKKHPKQLMEWCVILRWRRSRQQFYRYKNSTNDKVFFSLFLFFCISSVKRRIKNQLIKCVGHYYVRSWINIVRHWLYLISSLDSLFQDRESLLNIFWDIISIENCVFVLLPVLEFYIFSCIAMLLLLYWAKPQSLTFL